MLVSKKPYVVAARVNLGLKSLHFADKIRRVNFNFKERLEIGRHRHIKEWTDVNLSPNLVIKRGETIGKKCVGF